jgi:phage terminase large subunit-like protein
MASLPPQEQAELLKELGEPAALEFDWQFWGRRNQLEPPGDWTNWLILAGRGYGKTRTGAEWVKEKQCGDTPLTGGTFRHIAIVAETAADARDVMVGDGKLTSDPSAGSGILQVHHPDFLPHYEPSKRRLTWPNGAIATIYNAVEPEQLRGPQHDAAWCDELAKWRYGQETWDQLQFGLRTGSRPRVVITTTPRPIKLLKEIIGDPDTIVTRGSTMENARNLAPPFMKAILRKYQGTRLGRQELDAEVLEDVPGALWTRSQLEQLRVRPGDVPELQRVVIAIDPGVSTGENANETGIIAAGLAENGYAFILDDASAVHTPTEWATEAIALYKHRRADRIVGERNNGGDMVEATVRMVDQNVSFSSVWASRGKYLRAEPVSALYSQGRVHHVGAFPVLEDQMCAFTPDFDREKAGYSPDRLDAMVWAMTELVVAGEERQLLFA